MASQVHLHNLAGHLTRRQKTKMATQPHSKRKVCYYYDGKCLIMFTRLLGTKTVIVMKASEMMADLNDFASHQKNHFEDQAWDWKSRCYCSSPHKDSVVMKN